MEHQAAAATADTQGWLLAGRMPMVVRCAVAEPPMPYAALALPACLSRLLAEQPQSLLLFVAKVIVMPPPCVATGHEVMERGHIAIELAQTESSGSKCPGII